ncbi:DUF1771-domain-containing protein [Lophiostoma macrostomum CBS 122681]|uniref:DUF1771-domain-containing protein n=1 Tax=Lophiostoma macrostomum CBS 122681 TaxID=1314788 RepID=A0A6A6TFX4_9PLEO|nr:DUF1771-domain-containing protein [Lophiostoma macrostomum CBS 122681]
MQARPQSPPQPPDTTAINLERLLSRLEQTVLSPDASPALRKSSLERTRVSANVEYARNLLLNLEHSATTVSTSKSKKTALQADLQKKRELIKQLNQRLLELNQLDDSDSDGSDGSVDSDEEDQDNFPSYAPRVKEEAGLEVKAGSEGNEALYSAAQNLTSELRRRGGPGKEGKATSSGTSLFPSNSKTTAGVPSADHSEALLEHNRKEQENLTTSLLEMAKQLKQQSIHFGSTLENDKGILDRAVENLDKSSLGMEAAGQRMGTLRRMTEGKGWWARMKLYALIFGLWVAAFLIVFVALNHSSADTEAEYDRLRDLARQEAGKRNSCFDRSQKAYSNGDGAAAHQLSEEGKKHAAKMDQYNRQARDFIFRENNNTDRVPGDTIDLHGLFVEEAEDVLEERIREAQRQGQTHLHVIVGKGNHSRNHVQKIKPRVEQVCRELGLQYRTEENEGRIFVNLQGGAVHEMPPPPQFGGGYSGGYGGYPGQQQGGYQGGQQHHGQSHGGHQQQQHSQQQQQNDEVEELVKKGLPRLFKALKGCCVVM